MTLSGLLGAGELGLAVKGKRWQGGVQLGGGGEEDLLSLCGGDAHPG